MNKEEPAYTIYGDSPRHSHATRERESERVKSEALAAIESMGIRFPINSRREFLDAIPGDQPIACHYRGRDISLKELIGSLMDDDFPIKSPVEAANAMARACPIVVDSPESAPDTRPL